MTLQQVDAAIHMDRRFKLLLAAAVQEAAAEKRPYAVVACVPQLLSGERISDVVRVAAEAVRPLIREDDVAGLISGDIVVVGLPDTETRAARAFAHRLQSELGMRSAHMRNTIWQAGFACLPKDSLTPEALLSAAVESAVTRRRLLGV